MRRCQPIAALLVLLTPSLCFAEQAKVVSVRPAAQVQHQASTVPEPATVSRIVEAGDTLQTDAYGRMSVLLPNHMLLKMAEATTFLYRGLDASGAAGQLKAGKVWLRGQRRPTPFRVQTPTATAAIRGTEWYMEVAPDGTTTVGVLEGSVSVENSLGKIELASNELALIEPGKAPVKLAYLTPPNAVNWTLSYFGLWDEADYRRAGPVLEPRIREMVANFYRSELAEANRALGPAPAKENAQWQAAAGFLAMVSGQDDEATKRFRRAGLIDPGWALPTAHLALMALVRNDLERADKLSTAALGRDGNSAVAWVVRAYCLKAQLDLEQASEAAERAVALAPQFDAALLTAARIALELERYGRAEELLAQVPHDAPLVEQKQTLKGYLALRRSAEEEALSAFEQALAADAESPDALIGLGIALFQQSREAEALDAFVRATLVAPQVSAYQSYLAKAYFALNRPEDGLKALARAKRLDPKDPTPYLYEAIYQQSEYQPGRALTQLLEARKRNDNRAVFRSRYLLDQDQSVLTSNLAQVFNELGFDHSATQEAARALELDPTNAGAHRRLFFALRFDPRGYEQASASERLLNNMFMPPTRTAVVLDEDVLTPYVPVFDRPGIDTSLRGRIQHSDEETTESTTGSGNVLVAAEFDHPTALSLDVGGVDVAAERTELRAGRMEGGLETVNTETDDLELTYRGFLKSRLSEALSMFGEARYQTRDGDSDSVARANDPRNILGNSTLLTDSDGETEFGNLDLDFGSHLKAAPGLDGLVHVSYHRDETDTDTLVTALDAPRPSSMLQERADSEFWIAQTAIWKRFGGHFLQLGGRYYDQNADLRMTSSGPEEQDRVGDRGSELQSYFFLDQYTGIENIVAVAALNIDHARFGYDAGGESTKTTVGPSAGISWRARENMYLRGAYINNLAGDRSERLQQTLLAGFPFQRLTLIEPYTEEQLFNLEYETVALGWDMYLDEAMLFLGAEAEYDRQETESLADTGFDSTEEVSNDALRGRLYLEALLNPQTSFGLTYRTDFFDFPTDTERHGFDASVAHFFSWGMGLKFSAGVITFDEEGDSPADDTVFVFTPALEGYPFDERIRLNLAAPFDSDDNYALRFNFVWYLGR
ncbi:MAG: FecR domain-containing protein [Bdellovibrionales bacterium]|nr:FecR domain-containing protein [Bdellovibrionales bacterium]